MNDRALLRFYLGKGAPEAARWNLSPECLAAEADTRRRLRAWVRPRPGFEVLNVGIGVGEFDDFLGYWLENRGRLTSVDRDRSICDVFRHRQRREGHPNPARVVCAEILDGTLPPAAFDLVTVVGSTAAESGDARALKASCLGLLKPGGRLFWMGFHRPPPTGRRMRKFVSRNSSRSYSVSLWSPG